MSAAISLSSVFNINMISKIQKANIKGWSCLNESEMYSAMNRDERRVSLALLYDKILEGKTS